MTTSSLGWLRPILREEPVLSVRSPTKPFTLKPLGNVCNDGKKNKKSIYDYHWLVWKTGLTPTPAPATPTPPTPAPPTPDLRGYTPVEEDVPLPAHLCDAGQPSSQTGWVRPETPVMR